MALEKLIINGIDTRVDGVGSVPPGGVVTVRPIWATEIVTFLSGRQQTFRAPERGAVEVSVDAPDNYAVSLAVKNALDAAFMSFGSVSVTENLSNPGVEQTWEGYLTSLDTREVVGSNRELFNFKFTLRQEGA